MIDGGPPLLVNGNPADHCMETRWHSSSSHHGHHHHQCWQGGFLLSSRLFDQFLAKFCSFFSSILLLMCPETVLWSRNAFPQFTTFNTFPPWHSDTFAMMSWPLLLAAAGWNLQKPSRAEGNLVKVFFLYCSVLYDLNITDLVSKPGQFMNRNFGKFPSALHWVLVDFHPSPSELCLKFANGK